MVMVRGLMRRSWQSRALRKLTLSLLICIRFSKPWLILTARLSMQLKISTSVAPRCCVPPPRILTVLLSSVIPQIMQACSKSWQVTMGAFPLRLGSDWREKCLNMLLNMMLRLVIILVRSSLKGSLRGYPKSLNTQTH